jgi:hypothetical protein
MSRFLHLRTMTWVLGLWSAYVAAWAGITASGPALFTLWWLAGTIAFGSLWLARQPILQQARGADRSLVRFGRSSRAIVDLHGSHLVGGRPRDVG